MFVVRAFAVPGELHAHAAEFIDVELFALGADDGGHLRARDKRSRPRRGAPFDAVGHQLGGVLVVGAALGPGALFGLAGVLAALMADVHRAPAMVPVLAGMADEVEGQAGDQARVVAFDRGGLRVTPQAAQAVTGEGFATFSLLVAAGIGVVLVVLLGRAWTFGYGAVLLIVLRVFEGVVALGLAGGAHLLGVGEGAQGRFGPVAAGRGVVGYRAAGDGALDVEAVAVNQGAAVGAVLEAVEQPFLGGQAQEEVQVGVAGLDAVLAGEVVFGEVLLVGGDAVPGEQQVQNFRHGFLLEDAPVGAQLEPCQGRFDQGAVAGATEAGGALLEAADLAMDMAYRLLALPEDEVCRRIQNLGEVDGRVAAGQIQRQLVALAEALVEGELDDLELGLAHGEGETQVRLAGHGNSLSLPATLQFRTQ